MNLILRLFPFHTWRRCSNLYCSSSFRDSPFSEPLDFLLSLEFRCPILFLGFHPFSFLTLSISSFIMSSDNLTYFSSPLSSVSPLGLRKSPIMSFVLKLKFSLLIFVMFLFSKYCKRKSSYKRQQLWWCTNEIIIILVTYPGNVRILFEPLPTRSHVDHLSAYPRLGVLADRGLPSPPVRQRSSEIIRFRGVVSLVFTSATWKEVIVRPIL